MDLTTNFLGLKLKNPLIASASPLTASLESIKKLEDSGIAAVIMHSPTDNPSAYERNSYMYSLQHYRS
ncbi:MAG: hypothetical protein WC667_08230 [Sulfurimonas sp.]|jgi:dihydroorotate dehydrogenase (fumarate)